MARVVEAFLAQVRTLPWASECAQVYAAVRAEMDAAGRPLGALDPMIAAHAVEAGCILVTQDRGFAAVPAPTVEGWGRRSPARPAAASSACASHAAS